MEYVDLNMIQLNIPMKYITSWCCSGLLIIKYNVPFEEAAKKQTNFNKLTATLSSWFTIEIVVLLFLNKARSTMLWGQSQFHNILFVLLVGI